MSDTSNGEREKLRSPCCYLKHQMTSKKAQNLHKSEFNKPLSWEPAKVIAVDSVRLNVVSVLTFLCVCFTPCTVLEIKFYRFKPLIVVVRRIVIYVPFRSEHDIITVIKRFNLLIYDN